MAIFDDILEEIIKEAEKEKVIINKICSYYSDKYRNLTKDEKRKIFYYLIREKNETQLFDNNQFYEVLSASEIDVVNGFDTMDNLRNVQKVFDCSGLLEFDLLISLIERQREFKEEFCEELKLYEDILKIYKNVAQDLKFSSALDLSYFLTYLLWNGYLSSGKYYEYNLKDRVVVGNFYAAGVLHGKAACLENAALLRDFLLLCDKEALIMGSYIADNNWKKDFSSTPYIEKNKNKNEELKNRIRHIFIKVLLLGQKKENHSVTIVNENKGQYVFDPTNLVVLNILDGSKAVLVNGIGSLDLNLKSVDRLNPEAGNSELLYKLKQEKACSSLDKGDLIMSYKKVWERLSRNKKLLDDCYDEVKSSIEKINSKVLSMSKAR